MRSAQRHPTPPPPPPQLRARLGSRPRLQRAAAVAPALPAPDRPPRLPGGAPRGRPLRRHAPLATRRSPPPHPQAGGSWRPMRRTTSRWSASRRTTRRSCTRCTHRWAMGGEGDGDKETGSGRAAACAACAGGQWEGRETRRGEWQGRHAQLVRAGVRAAAGEREPQAPRARGVACRGAPQPRPRSGTLAAAAAAREGRRWRRARAPVGPPGAGAAAAGQGGAGGCGAVACSSSQ